MAPRPQNLDISGANASVVDNGRLIPRRPNFFMDLPSPRAGEVPPALSPLDAFALHSRALARKLEESSKAGRRMSRLPHHEIQTELAKRPGYFRSTSNESDAYSELDDGFDDDEEEVTETDIHTSPREDRPISHYPFLGNIANDDDDDNANERPLSTIHDESPAISPAPRGEEHNTPGYFGIKVPRSSSPEPFDPQATKTEAPVSPALPSLTSSMDSIGSSQPRTLTNESAPQRNQRGLAPPRSPLHPRSPRSAASIRSVIDSGEEDNANPGAFERARKASAASNPITTPSPDFPPISRSPSAMSDVSINEPLQRPSFNFSRPRSNSSAKLAVNTNRRPSYESRTVSHKHSNPSSLRDATSANQGQDHHTPLSARAPSRHGSDTPSGRSPSRANDTVYHPSRSRPLRNNSGNDSDTLFVKDPSRAHLGSDTRPRLVRGPSHRSPGPSRQNSGNTTDTLSVRGGPSRKNSANDGEGLSVRGPSRQNSANDLDARSMRTPSRQNSAYDSDNPSMRAPSRQNSAYDSDNRSMQAPSRQNSSNNLEAMSARGPSRQNSSNNLEALSVKAPSRKNSTNHNEDDWSISEADIFSGDESMYGEDSRAHNDLRDPEDPRAHNDPRDFRDPRDPRNTGAESYIYSKYSLPRGRTVERDSAEERKSWVHHQIKWEEGGLAAPAMKPLHEESLLSPRSDMAPPSLPTTPTKNESESAGSINRSRSAEPPGRGPAQAHHKAVPSTPSASSDSTSKTLRGRPHVRNSPSQDIAGLSPEQHLATGIEAHNAGSLSKSTYHLRLAARAGLPTAMLLYALACRHGWGMRPNQAEGVSWLKRAVDLSGSEFMTSPDIDPLSKPAPGEKPGPMTPEQKTRKAQFALAIYELGMSYNNGWGIPRDRTLALKCFEIAGSWGDNDALAEAGFCYSSGIGCKKDLKKAAGFYRRAAEGGMNMAGNSW